MEMYVQGVFIWWVKVIIEELCGYEFGVSVVSVINQKLDVELMCFMMWWLEEEYFYVILDVCYEWVCEDGVGQSCVVLIIFGIGWDGCCYVLLVELVNWESVISWKEYLFVLKV